MKMKFPYSKRDSPELLEQEVIRAYLEAKIEHTQLLSNAYNSFIKAPPKKFVASSSKNGVAAKKKDESDGDSSSEKDRRSEEEEYVYEQEECELLKRISDVETTHMQLIRDAYTNLIKIGTDKGNKKQKMAEKAEEEEENNNFDGKQLVLCIKKFQEIQDKLEKINEKARDEVLRIAKKYSEMCKPVYKKRKDIIKDIPNFWLTAFLRHPELGELVSTEDYEIFKFLSSIEVEKSKDVKSSYTITFYFNPNPHFKNTLLSKTYTFLEDGQPTKVTASTIRWSKGNGSVSRHAEDSFFRWFSSEVNQKDDEIAAIIKEELWQNPLTFFKEADEEKDEADDEVVKDNEHDGDEKAEEADEEKDEADDEVVKDNEHDGNEKADEADEEKDEADDEVVVDNEHDGDEKSDEEKDEADDEVVKDNEHDDNEKADEEKDKADDEVVKDNEHDGDEKADEEKDEADDEVVKDDEHDGDEKADEADEEDCEAAEDGGDEVVNDTEDDEEEADEDDLEGKDYDLGGW
ncbi:hypothetical protein K7X08_034105 [Anisodus acutangulus]|uniref:Uncharacterized protein n=1 Tax=Anisodus acutangulus TaxID=402998 RepID=A0A9Q1M137_9SOLA|nr:hypothetical protein K7X08_034105 [Anisodus acutangulus]